jgi:hypothetical protein
MTLHICEEPIEALVHQLNTDPNQLAEHNDWSSLGPISNAGLTETDAVDLHRHLQAVHTTRWGRPTLHADFRPRNVKASLISATHTLAVAALLYPPPSRWRGYFYREFEAYQVTQLVVASCGVDTNITPPPETGESRDDYDLAACAHRVVTTARGIVADLREHITATV